MINQIRVSCLKDEEEGEQIRNNGQHKSVQKYKSSLCRFYLRGNCPNPKQECLFAHGINDITFKTYDPLKQQNMRGVYYNFKQLHPLNQLDYSISEKDKNYVNLYQFQKMMAQNQKYTQTFDYYKKLRDSKTQKMKLEQKIQQKNRQKVQQKQQQIKQIQLQMVNTKNIEQSKKRGEYQHRGEKYQKISLYDPKKQYSLQQINSNRTLKIQIRKKFHQNQFKLFLQLLQQNYRSSGKQQNAINDYIFSYQILQLQYYRIGFNKLMTRIKLSFLVDYLLWQYKGGHFKFNSIMPPLRTKSITYYIHMPDEGVAFDHYRNVYIQLKKQFKQKNRLIRQQDVKQAMIRESRNYKLIPPILQMLRIKHCTFKQFFIRYILQEKQQNISQINLDWVTDQSILLSQIHKIIEEQIIKKQYCIVSTDIISKNAKYCKALVQKCVLTQREEEQNRNNKQKKDTAFQKQQKLILLRCPNIKIQIVTKQCFLRPIDQYEHQFGITHDVLIEDVVYFVLKKLANLELKESNLLADNLFIAQIPQRINQQKPDNLSDYRIIDICSVQELLLYSESIIHKSTLLGVDLQGSLTDGSGYLSLIQLNHYSQKIIFLIDYLNISKKQSAQGLQTCRSILVQLFSNKNIVKIIHDSRNDAECLYSLLGKNRQLNQLNGINNKQIIKFNNIFDTAACQQIINQIYHKSSPNIKTPGLNEVLIKYGQTPNPHKQKFHRIWAQGKEDPSTQRPMSKQFKEYCSMDVLGLPKVYMAMSKIVNPYLLGFVSQMHADWSQTRQKQIKTQSNKTPTPCMQSEI